jgi:hypothetical protein
MGGVGVACLVNDIDPSRNHEGVHKPIVDLSGGLVN